MTIRTRQFPVDKASLIRACCVGFTVMFLVWTTFAQLTAERRNQALLSGETEPARYGLQLLSQNSVPYPSEWVTTARLASSAGPEHDALSISLLERTVEVDPSNYEAWTLLAYLRTRSAGAVTEAAADALTNSFDACPLCNKDMLKWRLRFVLVHWESLDEANKLSAFQGADILRWWYLEYEYLNQIRAEARARGIPFDDYRKKVGTPVRPNEIGLDTD